MIDLARATVIVDKALAQGRTLGLPPLTVAVLDAGGRLIPVPEGVLIRSSGKSIIGAVGITGATSDQDEACAVAGIEAAGFTSDTGADPAAKQG